MQKHQTNNNKHMKFHFILFAFLLPQLSFGQNQILSKIPGTKCSLIPPIGFTSTTAFSGFQNTAIGASIMINELPAPYQTLIAGFTEEALLDKGMQLKSKETVDLNGSEATIIKVRQPANGISYLKLILIFGNEDYTLLVNGIYPEGSLLIEPTIESKIEMSLLSTIYDDSQYENALDAATFKIDVSGTEFKLVKYISGSLLYSIDGKIPTEKPTIIVGNSISKISVENQKQYAEDRINELMKGEASEIKEINELVIDGMIGFEIVANGKNIDDKDQLAYQVMLFNDEGDYYIFFGQTTEEFEKYLVVFQTLAKTFERK